MDTTDADAMLCHSLYSPVQCTPVSLLVLQNREAGKNPQTDQCITQANGRQEARICLSSGTAGDQIENG